MHNKLLGNAWKPFFRDGPRGRTRFNNKYISSSIAGKSTSAMPKDYDQLLAMRQQREKSKKKTAGYISSRITLQVLGSGARGAPRSLYVSTDHTKYLFNCSEGTQRLCHEHHLRLSKLENIFVTTPNWSNMGGMPGMALTIQENGAPSVTIHGPKGTSDLFRGIQRFVTLKGLAVKEAPCNEDEPYADQRINVRYVPLHKSGTESSSTSEDDAVAVDNVDYYAYDFNQNGKRSSSQERNARKLPRTEDLIKGQRVSGSMAYICKLPPKPGMLSLEKCVDRGISPGPIFGRLKAGEDVELPDGTVVLSSDVCEPAEPGPIFIVVECPEEEYLDSLLSSEPFVKHQASAAPDDLAHCVVHFTPEHILQNPRYRQWMERFANTTRHMIINEENKCFGTEAIHRLQHKLHLLHPTIFPFISQEGIAVDDTITNLALATVDENNKADIKSTTETETIQEEEVPMINRVKTLDAVHLRPLRGFDTSGELVLTPRAYVDEAFAIDGFLDSLAELQTELNARTKSLGEAPEYPKIIMLGTGSCIPNKTRNTSGILLRIDEENSIILDCGEGTADQMVRFYGRDKIDDVLATVKAVYISHLHADHHIGLIGLLKSRARVTKEPVMLLAPEQIGSWLRIYNRRFENIADKFNLIPNKDFDLGNRIITVAQETRLQQALKGVVVNTVRVRHCVHAFGVSITLKNGCKIVYSGDTMPCDALVDLGKDCDVLIHEATMEDDLEDEAKAKLHSTISQAIDVGERMRAKFTLLTHFSQRYSKLPVLPENGKIPNLERIGIAYDNMQISVSQLPLLPLMYPALNLMFSEFRELLEEKATKRQTRLEREERQRKLDEETRKSLP